MTRRRRRCGRSAALSLLVGLAMLASLAASAAGLGVAPARAQDDAGDNAVGNNVQGNTYTSPDFGFSLTWDRTWDVTDDVAESDPTLYNALTLANGVSTVSVEGTGVAIDPAECVENIAGAFQDLDGATDVEQADANLTGDAPNATYTLDFEDSGDVYPYTIYIQCQTILDGEAVLDVIHSSLTEEYDDQVDEREDLLEGLSLDGDVPEVDGGEEDPGQEDPTDEQAPDEDETDSTGLKQVSVPGGDGDRPASEDAMVRVIDDSIPDMNAYWARQYPLISGGEEYVPPAAWVTYTGEVETDGCGVAETGSGPEEGLIGAFYCPADRTVYLDLTFFDYELELVPNNFVIPATMAHELGHHIQNILGLQVCSETPCLDPDLLTSQEIEYMADCWAGSWTADAELRGRLGSDDVDATIYDYLVVVGGEKFESADVGGHGRASERIWWFLNGYLEGAGRCLDTSAATAGMLAEDPTTEEDSRDTPEADESPAADETPVATTVGLEEVVELPAYDFEATKVRVRAAIESEEPDEEQFVVVYFHVEIADDGDGPFEFGSWVLVDAAGTSYEVDENATNQLLSTAMEDGVAADLDGGKGYELAMVFDVPADVTGLSLVNADAGVTIELGL